MFGFHFLELFLKGSQRNEYLLKFAGKQCFPRTFVIGLGRSGCHCDVKEGGIGRLPWMMNL